MNGLLGTMLINPLLLALATSVAFGVGRVSGVNPQPFPIFAAAGIGFVAAELAVLPIVLNKGKSPSDVFLKAFFGTVLHLGISVALGAGAIFGLKLGNTFVYWLLGAYWITLLGLCMVFVRLLRSPVESAKLSPN